MNSKEIAIYYINKRVTNSKEIFELFFDTIPDPTLIVSYEDMKIYDVVF